MKDVADDLALIVRNAIAYIKELERQVNDLKREAEPVQGPVKQCMAHGECFGGECIYQRPAEPVQEPVAWRWGYRSVTTGEMDWRGYVDMAAHPNLRSPEIIMEPLYTAPPQRLPLSDADLAKIWDDALDQLDPRDQLRFIARAVERAHGIGGDK